MHNSTTHMFEVPPQISTHYKLLQNQIIPTYHLHNKMGYSQDWVKMSKRSIATLLPAFNSSGLVGVRLTGLNSQ